MESLREKRSAPGNGAVTIDYSDVPAKRRRKDIEKSERKKKESRSSIVAEPEQQTIPEQTTTSSNDLQTSAEDFRFVKLTTETRTQLTGNEAMENKGAKAKRLKAGIKELQREQKQLAALEPEERERTEKQFLMNRALQKVSGERVLDNLQKLKKRRNIQVKQKAAAKRRWNEREETLKSEQQAKDSRRKQHVEERDRRRRMNKARKGKIDFFGIASSAASHADAEHQVFESVLKPKSKSASSGQTRRQRGRPGF